MTVHVEDGLDSPIGKSYGVNTIYEKVFRELQERIDAGLARLDPEAARAGFAEASFASTTPSISVLEGGPRDRTPAAWKGVEQIWFEGPTGVAVLSLAEGQAHLAIGALVASQEGSLPPGLARELEQFAGRVERTLADSPSGAVRIPISEAELPVLDFMHVQVRVRDALPVRTLHRCRDCTFEKVTNPDYQRLMERNRKLRSLGSAVGATIGGGACGPSCSSGRSST